MMSMTFPRLLKTAAAVTGAGLIFFTAAYRVSPNGFFLSAAITCGTFFYHMAMRLTVGHVYNGIMNNHADYSNKWFTVRSWEEKLYKTLNVKKWKGRVPTYDPDLFSPKKHSWDEIAQAMCQSELVHETIALLSFLPLLAIPVFGSAAVFIATSLCAAACDLSFVAVQRYNRPKVLRHIKKGEIYEDKQK